MAGHLHNVQPPPPTPRGGTAEGARALINRPPICAAVRSTWVASADSTVGKECCGFMRVTCQKVVKIYRREIYNEEVRACKWGLQVCGLRLSFFPPHLFRLFRLYRRRCLNPRTSPATFFLCFPMWIFFSQLGNTFYVTLTWYIWHITSVFISWCVLHDCKNHVVHGGCWKSWKCCSKSHTYVRILQCGTLTWHSVAQNRTLPFCTNQKWQV